MQATARFAESKVSRVFEDIDLKNWTQSHANEYWYEWMTNNAVDFMNYGFKGVRECYL